MTPSSLFNLPPRSIIDIIIAHRERLSLDIADAIASMIRSLHHANLTGCRSSANINLKAIGLRYGLPSHDGSALATIAGSALLKSCTDHEQALNYVRESIDWFLASRAA